MLASTATGDLVLYPNIGGGVIANGPVVGSGWQVMKDISNAGSVPPGVRVFSPGAGDVNGDGAADVLAELKKHGVTHVLWLPDSETNWLYTLMKAEPSLTLVPVSREGLAFSGAAGVHAGGGKPVILIQNTGMLEAGDSLRGWGLSLNIPVVMMVGYRGYTRHGINTDTVADYTEPFLMAFGIKYFLVERDADAERISFAFEESRKKRRPVAVLVGDEYHGFN